MDDLTKMFRNNDNNQFKCARCIKYLSVSPIFHVPTVGFLCGRCNLKKENNIDETKDSQRQLLYESIAKDLTFPCSYNLIGCHAELIWGQVTKHENICSFRNTLCPLSDKSKDFLLLDETCSWRGNSQQLASHLSSSHQDKFINPPQIMLKPEFQTTFFFTDTLQQIMMVILKYNKKLDKFIVYVLANLSDTECNFFRYQVEINGEVKNSMILRRLKIEPLHDSIFKNQTDEGGLVIDMKTVREMLKDSNSYMVKVSVAKKNKKEIKVLRSNLPPDSVLNSRGKEKMLTIDEGILQELECPVCNDNMIPPIFLCQAGHSVCDSCNKMVNTCPTCRSDMLNTRNYTLEKLTSLVNYPCKNRSTGCFYVTSSAKIRNHERNCMLTGKNCILKCPWTGNTIDMIIHLTENHSVLQLDEVHLIFLNSCKKIKNEAIIFDNQVFLFTYTCGFNLSFEYSVRHLGTDSEKYKFELQIIDQSGHNLDFVLRHLCTSFVSDQYRRNGNEDNKQTFSLSYEMIEPFVVAGKEFYYKIKISNVQNK